MIIGNGLVAKGFHMYADDDRYLLFASGVSNSANKNLSLFEREKLLLLEMLEQHGHKTFVYFSTCSVYDPSLMHSLYVKHKLAMEALVRAHRENFYIFRISNLAGKTHNTHTVLNYFYNHIISKSFFEAWKNAFRNIIDIDDAVRLCNYIMSNAIEPRSIINIANTVNYPVLQIIAKMEKITGEQGNYSIVEKGSNPKIDTACISSFLKVVSIKFDEYYLEKTLQKYYSKHDL